MSVALTLLRQRRCGHGSKQIIHGKDTLGGIIEIVALNVPVGLGIFRAMGYASGSEAGAGDYVGAGDEGRGDWGCL